MKNPCNHRSKNQRDYQQSHLFSLKVSTIPLSLIYHTLIKSRHMRRWSLRSFETRLRKKIGPWNSRSNNFKWTNRKETICATLSNQRIQRSSVNQTSLCLKQETQLSNTDLAALVTSIFILIDHHSRATQTLSLCNTWVELIERANQVGIMFLRLTQKRMRVLKDLRSLRSSLRSRKAEMSNLMAEIVMWP